MSLHDLFRQVMAIYEQENAKNCQKSDGRFSW